MNNEKKRNIIDLTDECSEDENVIENRNSSSFSDIIEFVSDCRVKKPKVRLVPNSISKSLNDIAFLNTKTFQMYSSESRKAIAPGDESYMSSREFAPVPTSKTTVVFSLLNSKEFTARIEVGQVNPNINNVLKLIPKSRCDRSIGSWVFPIETHDNLSVILTANSLLVDEIPRNVLAAAQMYNMRIESSHSNEIRGILPEIIVSSLAGFQLDGVDFVYSKGGRALIADEMGLGKTRTGLASALCYRQEWPLLIICPSSAKYHWRSECVHLLLPVPNFLTEKDITIVENINHPLIKYSIAKRKNEINASWLLDSLVQKVFIISYDLVQRAILGLFDINLSVVICDESHYLKNVRSKRSKVLIPFLKACRRVIMLSGTPALSRPMELFSQLNILKPTVWNSVKEFGNRYCKVKGGERNLLGQYSSLSSRNVNTKGASNTAELYILLSNIVMIRRLKCDILQQLPKKYRKIVDVVITNEEIRSNLKRIWSEIHEMNELLEKKKKGVFVDATRMEIQKAKRNLLMELFRGSCLCKANSVISAMESFLSDPSNGKLVIFAHHRALLAMLFEHVNSLGVGCIKIDGSTSSRDRQDRCDRFQTSPEIRVAVLSITSAGIALNLTSASTVYFAELFWTPGSLLQAEDRCHRIGQWKEVNIFYFLAMESIDEILWPLVRKKMKTLGEIVEGHREADMKVEGDCSERLKFWFYGNEISCNSNSNSNNNSNRNVTNTVSSIDRSDVLDSIDLVQSNEDTEDNKDNIENTGCVSPSFCELDTCVGDTSNIVEIENDDENSGEDTEKPEVFNEDIIPSDSSLSSDNLPTSSLDVLATLYFDQINQSLSSKDSAFGDIVDLCQD